jgi:hypothetical protein
MKILNRDNDTRTTTSESCYCRKIFLERVKKKLFFAPAISQVFALMEKQPFR